MIRIAKIGLASVLAAMVLAGPVVAGGRDDLNTFTKGLKGLDGQFTQQVFDAQGKLKESSSGKVAVSAPRLFRWEYVKPYPQLIIADGRKVWVYDPDLQQVSVRPQGAEEQNSPLAVLVDPSRLDAQFVVKDAGIVGGLTWLSLAPRGGNDAGLRSARLGFGKTGLARMHFVDARGQRTEISFNGWKRNPSFAAGTFKYVKPKGVDLIGEG